MAAIRRPLQHRRAPADNAGNDRHRFGHACVASGDNENKFVALFCLQGSERNGVGRFLVELQYFGRKWFRHWPELVIDDAFVGFAGDGSHGN